MSAKTDPIVPSRSPVATWVGFAAMCVGMFMAILDVQIVATSLPTIQAALDINPDQMVWVQTAYLIAEVIAIPLTGFLTRLLTMRWLFVIAILVFTAASIGCAASDSFSVLIAWRIVQGFAGGTLIPAVFSAVFILFARESEAIATTLAGVLALLAPTVGPIVGGWITETYSWHWLFLVNVGPGIVALVLAGILLPREAFRLGVLKQLDVFSLMLMAVALSSLEIALKEAPQSGWSSGLVLGLLALAASCLWSFAARTLRAATPLVDLRNFVDRRFLVGSILSFVLGIGLFGSVYLMPLFLAFVRNHNALQIGEIMLVTGVVQLLCAPLAVFLEQRVDARLLTAFGFTLFATGLALSAFQTPRTDFDEMFWPQIFRGAAVMFCLLPPTRLALGHLDPARIPDASGLFNLMRNLGGAIGLALIDTIIYTRSSGHGDDLLAKVTAGDRATVAFLGIPDAVLQGQPRGQLTDQALEAVQPLIESGALTQAINDAWGLIAILTAVALLCVVAAGFSAPIAERQNERR